MDRLENTLFICLMTGSPSAGKPLMARSLFGPKNLETLHQPLEDKVVTISRAQGSLSFPANFMLVGAMTPCPRGWYGDTQHECTCSPSVVSRYQKRLSGRCWSAPARATAGARVADLTGAADNTRSHLSPIVAQLEPEAAHGVHFILPRPTQVVWPVDPPALRLLPYCPVLRQTMPQIAPLVRGPVAFPELLR